MKTNIEKEYAVLLSEEQYCNLKTAFDYQILRQTNYYFSSSRNDLGIRIRSVNNTHTFTIKQGMSSETLEYDVVLDKPDLSHPEVQKLLEQFRQQACHMIGKLDNLRMVYRLDEGEIALDRCEYLGQVDYEIEYELYDSQKGDEKTLIELLDRYGISYQENPISKYARFLNRLKAMKVAILCADGNEECEALMTYDLLKRANVKTELICINDTLKIKSAHGLNYQCDHLISDINSDDYLCMVLPGGMPGTTNLANNQLVNKWIADFAKQSKLIAAICAAPSILLTKGMLQDGAFAVFPGFEQGQNPSSKSVCQSGNIITAKSLGHVIEFAHLIIQNIKDKKVADAVVAEIMQN